MCQVRPAGRRPFTHMAEASGTLAAILVEVAYPKPLPKERKISETYYHIPHMFGSELRQELRLSTLMHE